MPQVTLIWRTEGTSIQQGECEDFIQSLITDALVNFASGAQHLLWFLAAAAGTALVHAPTAANGKAPVSLFRLLPVLRHQMRQNTLRVPYAVSRRAGESQPTHICANLLLLGSRDTKAESCSLSCIALAAC